MLKEFLEKVFTLGSESVEPINIGSGSYTATKLNRILEPTVRPLQTSSLKSVADYINGNIDDGQFKLVHIKNEKSIRVFSQVNQDAERNYYLESDFSESIFPFGKFMPYSEFIIALQSKFVFDDNVQKLLMYVGNIREENSADFKDDGISQTVVCKTGIARLENVVLPNRIVLRPYRTFSEVEQPASEFIFRIGKNSDCALFEADGGAWKREAVKNIRGYLEFEIKEKHLIIE